MHIIFPECDPIGKYPQSRHTIVTCSSSLEYYRSHRWVKKYHERWFGHYALNTQLSSADICGTHGNTAGLLRWRFIRPALCTPAERLALLCSVECEYLRGELGCVCQCIPATYPGVCQAPEWKKAAAGPPVHNTNWDYTHALTIRGPVKCARLVDSDSLTHGQYTILAISTDLEINS